MDCSFIDNFEKPSKGYSQLDCELQDDFEGELRLDWELRKDLEGDRNFVGIFEKTSKGNHSLIGTLIFFDRELAS